MPPVRGRFAPLAVRPFGRLLASYTLNELGDAVGIVALAVLVYDRTEAVAPTAAFFIAAKFLPALAAPALTARFDQVALRKSLPGLYAVEAVVFAALALIAEGTVLLLVGQAVALILFTLVIPIEVIYAKESLGTSDAGFGILLASWGAGIVVGSLLFLLVRQRSALGLIVGSTAAIGAAYLGLAVADTLLIACLVSVVGGAGNGVQWIGVMTALQEATPSDYQARIAGLLESLAAGMPGIGYLIGGALVAIGSPRTAYAVAGGGVLVLVLVAVALWPRLMQQPPQRRLTGAADLPMPDSLAP